MVYRVKPSLSYVELGVLQCFVLQDIFEKFGYQLGLQNNSTEGNESKLNYLFHFIYNFLSSWSQLLTIIIVTTPKTWQHNTKNKQDHNNNIYNNNNNNNLPQLNMIWSVTTSRASTTTLTITITTTSISTTTSTTKEPHYNMVVTSS